MDWGDGTAKSLLSASAPGVLAPAPHTFLAAGNYTVQVTVTDKDLGSNSASFHVQVTGSVGCDTPALTWKAPPGDSSPYRLGVDQSLAIRFRWGTCSQFIHDEGLRMVVRDQHDRETVFVGWVYLFDITINDAMEEYKVDFIPADYGVPAETDLEVDVYFGDAMAGKALIHVDP